MKLPKSLIEELTVRPGERADLSARSTIDTATAWLEATSESTARALAEQDLAASTAELAQAQQLLYTTDTYALLVILQALDAAGKDGTIKHVMSGVNPQGCEVTAFKAPSDEELNHDFLWRCERALPGRGRIGIFNRSYYEEVLVAKVHPEILDRERLPPDAEHGEKLWSGRYDDINAFEHHLDRSGTRIVKIFLHVSKEEQKHRLLERLDDPEKYWKFSAADLAERGHFEEYTKAYESALSATSTTWAPWYVIPADHKYLARALVGGILTHTIEQLDLAMPMPTDEQRVAIAEAKQQLLAD